MRMKRCVRSQDEDEVMCTVALVYYEQTVRMLPGRTLRVMVSGYCAAMEAAISASAVGVTTLGGAATSCLVSTTPGVKVR